MANEKGIFLNGSGDLETTSGGINFGLTGSTGSISFNGVTEFKVDSLPAIYSIGSKYPVYYDLTSGDLYHLQSKPLPPFVSEGFNNSVESIGYLENGHLITAGRFTLYGANTLGYVTSLNTSGEVDTTVFNPGSGSNSIYYSTDLIITSDNKVILNSRLLSNPNPRTYNGTTVFYPQRFNTDGSIDISYNPGSGAGGSNTIIYSMSEAPDGGYIFSSSAGTSTYNGTSVGTLYKTNSDGTLNTTWSANSRSVQTVQGLYGTNTKHIQLPDGRIAAFNVHPTTNFSGNKNFSVLNEDGTLAWTATTNSSGNFGNVIVEPGTTVNNYKILVLGKSSLTTWNGASIGGSIFRIDSFGNIDDTFTPLTTNGDPYATGYYDVASEVYFIGGGFTIVNGLPYERICSFDYSGALNESFVRPSSGFFNSNVNKIVKFPGGNYITVAGSFTTYGGVSSQALVRLDFTGSIK